MVQGTSYGGDKSTVHGVNEHPASSLCLQTIVLYESDGPATDGLHSVAWTYQVRADELGGAVLAIFGIVRTTLSSQLFENLNTLESDKTGVVECFGEDYRLSAKG